MKKGKAKRLVMQPRFRVKVERDRHRYSRKVKHRKAPETGGFSFVASTQTSASSRSIMPCAWPT